MKETVFVQRHISIEVDHAKVKELYGKVTKQTIEEYCWEEAWNTDPYMTTYEFAKDKTKEEKLKKPRRGIGSY